MLKTASGFTKKKALSIVLICSILLFLVILIRWLAAYRDNSGLMTLDGRESFIFSLGWKIDRGSEQYKKVIIPEKLEGSMADYNALQLSQGYDLSKYAGKECSQYTYKLTNYDGSCKDVYITVYICGRSVIAGDIHTVASDGFMHGIKSPAKM